MTLKRLCQAEYARCRPIGPKMFIVCGHCQAPFKNKMREMIEVDGQIAGYCPHCNYWNKTGFEPA